MEMASTPQSGYGEQQDPQRYRQTLIVTLVGSVFDLLLGVGKIIIGFSSHSQGLVADGVHSLSDLFTDFLVIWAAKHSHAGADDEHPYGHARIETVATVLLGLALAAVAIGIGYDAVERLFHPTDLPHPGMLALVMAGSSVVIKEAIYHYTMWAAKKYRSNMLKANAWHSRSDAISSIVVMVGVAGTMAGLPYLDGVAAVIVALMIGKIAWDLIWHNVQELIDASLDAERVAAIRETIMKVNGVKELHMLRTRRRGPDALVDVHVIVDSYLSISEGHHIAEAVQYTVIKAIDEVSDVMVHIDPEDDEEMAPCSHLPLRNKVVADVKGAWADIPEARRIEDLTLHYLDGEVEVEVLLPLSVLGHENDAERLRMQFNEALGKIDYISDVRLYYY